MSKTKDITLDEAVRAARQLPEQAQRELAAELMEHVEDVSRPGRPAERHALIKERLGRPLRAVSRDELTAMLRQYNPAS